MRVRARYTNKKQLSGYNDHYIFLAHATCLENRICFKLGSGNPDQRTAQGFVSQSDLLGIYFFRCQF